MEHNYSSQPPMGAPDDGMPWGTPTGSSSWWDSIADFFSGLGKSISDVFPSLGGIGGTAIAVLIVLLLAAVLFNKLL